MALVAQEPESVSVGVAEDGEMMVPEVQELEEDLPERPNVECAVLAADRDELLVNPCPKKLEGERVRVVTPHAEDKNVDGVVRPREGPDPQDLLHPERSRGRRPRRGKIIVS